MFTFNVNARVQFVLTEDGEKICREHYRELEQKYNLPPWLESHAPIDDKGTRHYTFWELMSILGPHFHIGGKPLIVNNELTIVQQSIVDIELKQLAERNQRKQQLDAEREKAGKP